MSVQLLDKTRKINKLLHNNNSSKVVFNDICQVLTEILDSNIAELLIQVVKITNRGVHGEIVNQKYMDFASQAYPQIMKELNELQNECKTGKMRKVNLMDFEYYSS